MFKVEEKIYTIQIHRSVVQCGVLRTALEHRRDSGDMGKVSRILVTKDHELRHITCQDAGRNLKLEG